MNCLEFRRLKLAEPRRASPEQLRHMQICPSCAEFSAREDEFESEMESALRVPVPEGFADRILLAHKLRHRSRVSPFALAASVVVGIALATTMFLRAPGADAVAEAAIDHVLSEPEALQDRQPVSEQELADAFAVNGGQLNAAIGSATHLSRCKLLGSSVSHLVLSTPYGKATVIVIPQKIGSASSELDKSGLSAVAVPAGHGSIGIVAGSPKELRGVENMLLARVDWKA